MPERLALSLLAPLALLVAACTPVPVGSAADAPSAGRGAGASDVASPSVSAQAGPTASSAVPSTPGGSPGPTLTPAPGALEQLELDVVGCPGGVVLDWASTFATDFHHYTALRSPEMEIDPAYPPIAPAVDWGDSYATDRFVTSAVDQSIVPTDTTWYYRVMGYDASNRPVAASSVRHARLHQPVDLGPITLAVGAEPGATRIDWALFGGLARCFSAYRVLIAPAGGTPATTLTVISDQSLTELETDGLHPGASYAVRVEAVRTTTLGELVVARTSVGEYTVPAAVPSSAAP